MQTGLGILAILVLGCATDYTTSDASTDAEPRDGTPGDGAPTDRLGHPAGEEGSAQDRAAIDRDPQQELATAPVQAPERPGDAVVSGGAEAGAAHATSGSESETAQPAVLCGQGAVCVEARRDPIEACRAALPAFAAANVFVEPSDCTLVSQSPARASSGAIRSVAFVSIRQMQIGFPVLAVLEGERGFDRVVYLLDINSGINQNTEYAFGSVVIEDLVPAGSLEARIELTRTIDDSACTEPLSWQTKRTDVFVCGIDAAGRTYCTPPIPRAFEEIELTYFGDDDEGTVTGTIRFALAITFRGDEIVVRRTRGRVPRALRPLLGRRAPTSIPGSRL